MKQSNKDRLRSHFKEHGTITRNEAATLKLTARLSERVREFEAEGMKFSHEWVYANGERTSDFRYTLLNRAEKTIAMQGPNGVRMVPESLVHKAVAAGYERLS